LRFFIIERAFPVHPFDDGQFAVKNFCEKISVSVGRFQKSAVNAIGFLFHQIQHGIYFTLIREDFAMIGYSLFGDDLFFHDFIRLVKVEILSRFFVCDEDDYILTIPACWVLNNCPVDI
jgi:hypothetical protein